MVRHTNEDALDEDELEELIDAAGDLRFPWDAEATLILVLGGELGMRVGNRKKWCWYYVLRGGSEHMSDRPSGVIEYPSGDICPECDRECSSERGLKIHFTKSHPDKKRGNQFPWEFEGDVQCPSCGRYCANENGMRRHHKWEHDTSIARATIECDNCGKERETFQSKAERLSSGFCKECIENEDLGEAHPSSRERSDEVIEKIAEGNRGKSRPDYVIEAAQEGWQRWWENEADQEAFRERLINHQPDEISAETKEKISETLTGHPVSEERREKIRQNSQPGYNLSIEVEETGHTVRSYWEEEIDLLLYKSGYEYKYEPGPFDIGEATYLPDFKIQHVVIEVKGYANEHSISRAEAFLEDYPDFDYLVLGDSAVPHDYHIEWDCRHQLLTQLSSLL